MKLAFIADAHLGFMQYGIERRKRDFERVFQETIRDILSNGISTMICAGDILESNRPDPASVLCLQQLNDYLIQGTAVMYVTSGNHELTRPHWIEVLNNSHPNFGFKLLDYKTVEPYPDNPTQGAIKIHGIPYMSREEILKYPFPDADILVGHMDVQEISGAPKDLVIQAIELPLKYRLIVVGHIHARKTVMHPGNPGCAIISPGSTELHSESEDENKFWLEYDTESNVLTEHLITTTRKVLRVDLIPFQHQENAIESKISGLQWDINHSPKCLEPGREPMIFVRYPMSMAEVIPKFRAAFDPDKYVLRFRPIGSEAVGAAVTPDQETSAEMSVRDILTTMIPVDSDLFPLAEKLIDPETDATQLIERFLEQRLQAIQAKSSSVVIPASEAS